MTAVTRPAHPEALADGRLRIASRQVVESAGAPTPGLNLNPQVAQALARSTP